MRLWGAAAAFVLLSATVAFAQPGLMFASLDGKLPAGAGDKAVSTTAEAPHSALSQLRLIFYSGAVSAEDLRRYADDPRACALAVCLVSTEEEVVSTAYRALKTQQQPELAANDDAEAWDRTIDIWNTSIAGIAALAGLSGSAIAYLVGRRQGETRTSKRRSSRVQGASAASRSRARTAAKNPPRPQPDAAE